MIVVLVSLLMIYMKFSWDTCYFIILLLSITFFCKDLIFLFLYDMLFCFLRQSFIVHISLSYFDVVRLLGQSSSHFVKLRLLQIPITPALITKLPLPMWSGLFNTIIAGTSSKETNGWGQRGVQFVGNFNNSVMYSVEWLSHSDIFSYFLSTAPLFPFH